MKNFRGVHPLDRVRRELSGVELVALAYIDEGHLFAQETSVLWLPDLMDWCKREGRYLVLNPRELKEGDVLIRNTPDETPEYKVAAIVKNRSGGLASVVITRSAVLTDPENWNRIVAG